MSKAEVIFKEHINDILNNGVWSQNARPKYKDGTTANSKYITMTSDLYDLNKGEFPIISLRPIAYKTAINEMLVFYQDKSNKISDFEARKVGYWKDWSYEYQKPESAKLINKTKSYINEYNLASGCVIDYNNMSDVISTYNLTEDELKAIYKYWYKMFLTEIPVNKAWEKLSKFTNWFVESPLFEHLRMFGFNDNWLVFNDIFDEFSPYGSIMIHKDEYEDYKKENYSPCYIKLNDGSYKYFVTKKSADTYIIKNKLNIEIKPIDTDKYVVRYEKYTPTIGNTYGAVIGRHQITDRLLEALRTNPWNRRNIVSLWDYAAFDETPGALLPCAWNTMFDVREIDGEIYLDQMLTMRSNDMLVAQHMDTIQYVALQMMLAKHFGWKLGKFRFNVMNMHIYSNQFEQANELLSRPNTKHEPYLKLNVPDGTNFYDIKASDFEMVNYEPIKPQIKFPDLAV